MNLPGVIDDLRKIAGRDAVLDRPEDLMLYEYDARCAQEHARAPSSFRKMPNRFRRSCALASAAHIPVVGSRRGHRTERRRDFAGWRHCHCFLAHEPHSGSRCGKPARRGAARSREPAAVRSSLASRAVFCARSLQPESLHHRRQCRGEFRRAAHADAWRHRQSRNRSRSRAARAARSCSSAARLPNLTATT